MMMIMKFYCLFRIFLFVLCIMYVVVCFVYFYLILYIIYSYFYIYVFLLLCMFSSVYSVSYCVVLYTVCV